MTSPDPAAPDTLAEAAATPMATSRVVIAGAGLAALYAALSFAPRPVLVLSPGPLGEGASSAYAQGGVAAAVGPDDSPARHAADTRHAGAGTVDAAVADHVTEEALGHILALAARGAPFDRTAEGDFILSREAAHSRARVVRVRGDGAGRAIMAALIAAVRATPSIQVLEGVVVTGLEGAEPGGRIIGPRLAAASGRSGEAVLRAPAVLLATGGLGGLYARTTNPGSIRGQGLGLAARAGAVIADAEFVQFHPTAIDCGADPLPLATEALRGEGATLVNADGLRFMRALHPDAELAPRDIVARAVFAETRAGRRPALDTRAAVGAAIDARFPTVAAACRALGLDPVAEPIPIAAAAHYHMGGVAVTEAGRTSLPGLWAIGEVSSTGLHGANRLASNGLLEALVFGHRSARDIAAALDAGGPDETGQARAAAPEVRFAPPPGDVSAPPEAVAKLRALMTEHVGVARTGAGLETALRAIAALEATETSPLFRAMTTAATLVAAAALARRESRGGHFRADFPEPDPALAHRSRVTWAEAEAIRCRALSLDETRLPA